MIDQSDFDELLDTIEAQSRRIEELGKQIAKLNRVVTDSDLGPLDDDEEDEFDR